LKSKISSKIKNKGKKALFFKLLQKKLKLIRTPRGKIKKNAFLKTQKKPVIFAINNT